MIRATMIIEDIVRKYPLVVNPLAEAGFPYSLWESGMGYAGRISRF